jgi:O-methyltransferase/8-demethyl-8-(2,3-dimethoxy-alpha-L-rhamnosyl)tetracenomycin-C 4'-O-methyltransferase
MYESYLDSLFNTYALLQVGGFVLIDDYSVEGCARAVAEFRSLHGIEVSAL